MMNPPIKKLLLPLALVALVGCHSGQRIREIKMTVAHDNAAQTAIVTCKASSTGKCHLAITGAVTPSIAEIKTGDSVVFQNVTTGTKFCGEAHVPSPDSCAASAVPDHYATIEKRSSSDSPSD